jgi:hypothetical protein
MVWRSRCGVCALGKFACGSVRAVCGRRGGHSVRRGRKARGGQTPALSGCCVDVVSRPRGLPRVGRDRTARGAHGEPERDGPTVNGHSERTIDSERYCRLFLSKGPAVLEQVGIIRALYRRRVRPLHRRGARSLPNPPWRHRAVDSPRIDTPYSDLGLTETH